MNLEQALKILGGDFSKCEVTKNKHEAYSKREDGGLSVRFRYSKVYDNYIWWTSEMPINVDCSNYIIIALQNRGLLVLPREIIIHHYWDKLNVSTLKNGRRNIRIKEDDGKLVLFNRKDQETIEVTKYLHSFNVG